MAPGIYHMNESSWEALVLSMLKSEILRTVGTIPYQENKFNCQQENNSIVKIAVDEILLHEKLKVSDVKKAPKNVDSGFYEN